jgi:Co/Zn/Cd efflux system component
MDGIRELLAVLKEKAEQARTAKLSGSWWGWIAALGIGIIIALGSAFLLTKLRRRNGELAKARTDLEQQEARLRNLEYQRKVAVHEHEITALQNEADILKLRVKHTKTRLADKQRETDHAVEEALKVRDWAALDAKNQEGR